MEEQAYPKISDRLYSPVGRVATSNTKPIQETEIEREFNFLKASINELGVTCESVGSTFSPVLRGEPETDEGEHGPEQATSTKIGTEIADVRRKVNVITSRLQSFIRRSEV